MKFERDIMTRLKNKLEDYSNPLLVMGVRQIGKTTAIKNFLNNSEETYICKFRFR